MTYQEFQVALNVLLGEVANIKVTMKRLANDIHLAMNTSAWGVYSKRYYRADDLLTLKKEEIAALKSRYYAQFPLTVEQCADIGLPSGVTNFYGQDLY
jgi:hypothetical protein